MKWVSIRRLDFEGRADIKERTICFGRKSLTSKVFKLTVKDKDFLFMSSDLIDTLCIKESLPYQVKVENNRIRIGPVIGLLLGRQCIYYNHKNMREQTDALSQYEKTGGLFYAFTPEGIDYENKLIYGLYFGHDKVWRYSHFPFPDVIFRRGFSGNELHVDKIRQKVCEVVFNQSRRNKWEIHQLLEKDGTVSPFLPETCEVQQTNVVLKHLKKYTIVILKPTDLSRGRGIFILREKNSKEIEVTDCLKKDNQITVIKWSELDKFLRKGGFFRHHYIVQNRLDLATVNGSPFDIRVMMQKTKDHQWRCSGIECRIAGMDHMISNIARGGRALSVNRTLLLAFGPDISFTRMKKQMIEVSENICRCMDHTGELFAEFGLDIAVDREQHLWFIEANVRPSFKGFKRMDYKNYLYICSRPIIYAVHLAGFESDGDVK